MLPDRFALDFDRFEVLSACACIASRLFRRGIALSSACLVPFAFVLASCVLFVCLGHGLVFVVMCQGSGLVLSRGLDRQGVKALGSRLWAGGLVTLSGCCSLWVVKSRGLDKEIEARQTGWLGWLGWLATRCNAYVQVGQAGWTGQVYQALATSKQLLDLSGH